MPNPITVTLNIPYAQTLYIMADVWATSEQKVTITAQPPLKFADMTFTGSGVATDIGHQGVWLNGPTQCVFTLLFEYQAGTNWYSNSNVTQSQLTVGSPVYVENVVISQNGVDNADCCTVRFVAFS